MDLSQYGPSVNPLAAALANGPAGPQLAPGGSGAPGPQLAPGGAAPLPNIPGLPPGVIPSPTPGSSLVPGGAAASGSSPLPNTPPAAASGAPLTGGAAS